MATCVYPSQAEDFIPLSMTESPEHRIRPSRRPRKLRIIPIPEFCTPKLSEKADGGSTGPYNATLVSVPRSHLKRSGDASSDDHFNGYGFPVNHNPHKMSKASPDLGQDALQQTLNLARQLREKDKEIARMGQLNRALQDRVHSLAAENRIWRGLAQDNEAEADSIRAKLVRALARGGGVDDAESSCGSIDIGTAGEEDSDAAAEWRPACT